MFAHNWAYHTPSPCNVTNYLIDVDCFVQVVVPVSHHQLHRHLTAKRRSCRRDVVTTRSQWGRQPQECVVAPGNRFWVVGCGFEALEYDTGAVADLHNV